MSKNFLDLVLPDAGLRCIASNSERGFVPTFHSDNGAAASTAVTLENSGRGEIYFGCASYVDAVGGRKGVNVHSVRSFWLDFDTDDFKRNGKSPYADRSAALVAYENLCFRLALSASAIVSSGYGLHIYWALDADLPPDEWRETAEILERACVACGVTVDRSRTTDIASVLRVPGTHNRKAPHDPRPVEVLSWGARVSHAQFRAQLLRCIDQIAASGLQTVLGVESNVAFEATTDHWFDRLSPEDKDACLAAMLHIPAVIALADTPDDAPSPNWRTVVAACARSGAPNAKTYCRDWAATSGLYDPDDFEKRWGSYARG